jgi:precorrin-2 methylase
MSRRGSLVVVGTGISSAGQTTLEALASIERAEQLFYLVTDPTTEFWIRRLNPSAMSLEDLYAEGKPRYKTYQEMAERLMAAVRSGRHVCAAFYGHPGVLVTASHAAIRQARREGYSARMFPGISTEACLVADLGVNPGDRGLQSFEATDFLLSRRKVDPTSDLVLWQVGALGEPSIRTRLKRRPDRLRVLVEKLGRLYPRAHRVVVYEAASFPTERHRARRVALERLPEVRIVPMATVFIPALASRRPDPRIQAWYDEPPD